MAANNLCNSYTAFNTNYHDTGLFGVIATAEKGAHIDDLSWAIMHEVPPHKNCHYWMAAMSPPSGSVRTGHPGPSEDQYALLICAMCASRPCVNAVLIRSKM